MRTPSLLVASLLLGCSQTPPAPIRKPDCVAGAMAACLCEGDLMGWQTCGADRRLGPCVCGDGGAPVTPPPMCVDPFAFCNGRCANLLVDGEHCGRCSAACGAGQLCFNGSCALLADAGAPRAVPPLAAAPDAGRVDGGADVETDGAAADVTDATDDAPAPDDVPAPDATAPDATAPDATAPDDAVTDLGAGGDG